MIMPPIRGFLAGSGIINVKQKVGCLPYRVDLNGFQSIHSQFLMKDAVKGWNFKVLIVRKPPFLSIFFMKIV